VTFEFTLFASLPYLAGFLVQQLSGWRSDKTGERRWHAAVPMFLCGLTLLLAVNFWLKHRARVTLFTLVGAFYLRSTLVFGRFQRLF